MSRHLAVLNLFREADGTVEITVAGAPGALEEFRAKGLDGVPQAYVEDLVIDAAKRMRARRAARRRRTKAR